jgi:PAP2 superfamily
MSATARTSELGVPAPFEPATDPGSRRMRRRLVIELAWVAGMLILYNVGRYIAKHHVGPAFDNAMQIWDFERWLQFPSEQSLQEAVLRAWPWGVEMANSYYATMHFPVTVAFLVWMFVRRPDYYLWIRRALVILTSAALIGHLAFPLAPPRMLPELGFVDTGILYDMSVYGAHGANSLANQYAAMPSLHVAWAALVAVGLIVSTKTRWRWFWMIHPAITLAVVVVTANHYWLDGVIGLILLAIALAVTVRARPEQAAEAAASDATVTEAEPETPARDDAPSEAGSALAPAEPAPTAADATDLAATVPDTPIEALDTPDLRR